MFSKIITTTIVSFGFLYASPVHADIYVRPDVRLAIRSQSHSIEQERTSLYLAGVLEKAITVSNPSVAQLNQLARDVSLATVCVFDAYGRGGGKQSVMIESFVLNTPQKQRLYDQFNRLIAGTMQELPSTSECSYLQ